MLGRFELQPLEPAGLSRRRFLQVSALAGGGFIIGFNLPRAATAAVGAAPGAMNPFIRIGADNTVTVVIKHLDKGQGVTTGLPTIVAEELDADWSQMRAEFAPANAEKYKNLFFGVQGTGGSSSIANSWTQLRIAGAGARQMLLQAAGRRWEVDPRSLKVEGGVVREIDGSRTATFGELANEAAKITPPAEPPLKEPKDFRLIGKRLPRLDSPAKTDGTAQFTLDVSRPGMLVAVVAHPPKFGATVKNFDASKARAMDGVKDVVQIPRGVAVLADSYHTAVKARAALTIDWDETAAEKRGSEELLATYRKQL
ncbi:MAG: molybdopterin cofactor-binding domain-containing protein, partial [Xanthomonadales bacterium]|nr:molybdopterin cofactor-binding domain-containing protein [Xanthomonadales bacterium]